MCVRIINVALLLIHAGWTHRWGPSEKWDLSCQLRTQTNRLTTTYVWTSGTSWQSGFYWQETTCHPGAKCSFPQEDLLARVTFSRIGAPQINFIVILNLQPCSNSAKMKHELIGLMCRYLSWPGFVHRGTTFLQGNTFKGTLNLEESSAALAAAHQGCVWVAAPWHL